MLIKSMQIAELANDPANARKHSERNIEAIRASLKRFGQQKPIVVDSSGVVRAGNGTLEAARLLGWDTIDVVVSDLQGSEATAYAIADNRTAELAEWDDEVLTATLEGLQLEGLLDDAGFSDDELAELMKEIDIKPEEITEDEIPEPPVDPITKRGDLWLLGNHRLLCGDSTKAEDVERLMAGAKADLCFTSPPYSDQRTYTGDGDLTPEHLSRFITEACRHCDYVAMNLGIARKQGFVDTYWDTYIDKARESGFGLVSWNVWYRTGGFSVGQITAMFPIEHEFIFVFGQNPRQLHATVPNANGGAGVVSTNRAADGTIGKQKGMVVRSHRELGTVIVSPPVNANDLHPAQFPVLLPAEYIKAFGDSVYEPFCGSGTTLIAAEQLGRKCYGMEISPQYCDVIVKRWENLTGEKAKQHVSP